MNKEPALFKKMDYQPTRLPTPNSLKEPRFLKISNRRKSQKDPKSHLLIRRYDKYPKNIDKYSLIER